MNFVALTNHAKDQCLDRYGIGHSTLQWIAEQSVIKGFSIKDAPNDRVRSFLRRKTKQNCAVYGLGPYVFVFGQHPERLVLITTYLMPEKLQKTINQKWFE